MGPLTLLGLALLAVGPAFRGLHAQAWLVFLRIRAAFQASGRESKYIVLYMYFPGGRLFTGGAGYFQLRNPTS